jgi:hypothetical protein
MTSLKLHEAIEMLRAITEYRRNSPNVNPEAAASAQHKVLKEVTKALGDFSVNIDNQRGQEGWR